MIVITARILIQKRGIDKQIAQLQSQVDKIKKNNDQLTYLNKYFETPEYQEKQAREKLNLAKPGEYVVVLPSDADKADFAQADANKESNAKQWFNYFFNHAQ